MKIAVGTTSALKLRAVKIAAATSSLACFEPSIEGVDVDSGIPDQPFGTAQMQEGAKTRARLAMESIGADMGIGIESGLVQMHGFWFDLSCIVVLYRGEPSIAFSAGIPVPDWMVEEIREKNTELGAIIQGLAQGGEKDAFAFFSKGALKREEAIRDAVVCACAPLLNIKRYKRPF